MPHDVAAAPLLMISPGNVYSMEALRAFGIGAAAIRAARRKGLRLRKLGKRRFVLGAELVAFIAACPSDDGPPPPTEAPA